MQRSLSRREAMQAAGGLALSLGLCANAGAADPIYLADMHFHLRFGDQPTSVAFHPLKQAMADAQATLVACTFSADLPWLGRTPKGIRQTSEPHAGQALSWFERRVAGITRYFAEQGIKIVRDADDIAHALAGEPHAVLSTEGSNYLEADLARLTSAYDLGVRNMQLVHYSRNAVGDFQTEVPQHRGLTDFGKDVVAECNRLGILVDLAHSTEAAMAQALDKSKAPMLFSHGSIAKSGTPNWTMPARLARQVSLATAKRIAQKGGVIGLWGLRPDVGTSIEAYANRLSEMADLVGEDHVAFGTDINGMGESALLTSHVQLRKVIEHWQKMRVNERRIRKIAIENYARVLKEAMRLRLA